MDDFYALKLGALWDAFRKESFAFWMTCAYLFFEYVRPQSIFPVIDVLPWARLFLIGALLGWIADGKAKWVSVSSNKWMLFFLLVIIASVFTAEYPVEARKSFMDVFSWIVVYFVLVLNATNKKRFYILLLIFLFASFKISFSLAITWARRGFSFTSWGLQGPPGYFTNSGELSIQMLVYGPVGYQLWMVTKPYLVRWKRIMLLLMPITAAMTVMGASSRGSQLGIIYQIYALFLKGRLSFKNIILTAVIACAAYYAIPDQQMARFRKAGDDKTSEQRLLYWRHGAEMIKEHPVLGVGFFNFIPYYQAHYSYDMLYPYAQLPHNIFVQVGTDAGCLGLFSYSMLILQTFLLNRRTRKIAGDSADGNFFVSLSKGLDVGMMGFLIAGQFVTVGYYPFIWVNLAFSAALHNVCSNESAALVAR